MEKVLQLKRKHDLLRLKLAEKLLDLRAICLKEAEITGRLPPEFPDIPGQPPPTISRRIGTGFLLPSKFLEKDAIETNDAIEKLELAIEIQRQKANATRRLSEDKSLSKSARKHHHQDFLSQSGKLKQLTETLGIYMEERGQGKIAFSKTTDDVDYKSVSKADDADQGCYQTLPNPRRRRPVTPQPQQPQRNSSSNSTSSSTYKMSQTISDSMIGGGSISSNSSSLIGSSSNRQMAHHPNSSYVIARGYTQLINGGPYGVNHRLNANPCQWQKVSMPPSSVNSSDMASSCSSSRSSLQLNSGADRDSGTYDPHREPSLNPHLDPTASNYSSYLRNTQKAYFAPGGRHAYESLDRKKTVARNGSGSDAALPIAELTELTPSKFGSKRESTVDAEDSPYRFEDDDDDLTEEPQDHRQARNCHRYREPAHVAPPFGRLKESSSESSGIHSAAEERRCDARWRRPDCCDGKQRLHFRPADDRFVQNSGSFNSRDSAGSRSVRSGVPLSEMSDVQEYTESLRCVQQRRLGARETRPAASPGPEAWTQQTVQTKKTKNPGGQGSRTRNRKSLSNIDANQDAVDALFKHNNQRSGLNAVEFSRRNSSIVVGDLPQHGTHLSNYARGNSFSLSTASSAPQPLRFVKVNPSDPMQADSSDIQDQVSSSSSSSSSSYSRMPSAFELTGCSTLV